MQGKSAIGKFEADLLSPSFPTNPEEIGAFISAKYLERAKDVLVQNLIKAILSAPFGTERGKYANRTRLLAVTLYQIAKVKPSIYDELMPNVVARKFEHVSSDILLSICPFLQSDPRIWNWLLEPDRTRIRRLVEASDVEELKAIFAYDLFAIPALSETLLDRFNDLNDSVKISIIAEHPRKQLVVPGIEIYSSADSFRYAEQIGHSVILSLADFYSVDHLNTTLTAASANGQIWHAGGTQNVLCSLFDRTISLLPVSQPHWQAFVDEQIARMDGDETEYYAYPELQQRLAQLA